MTHLPIPERARQGGQSLVEFTIIFPTLILLILGIVQFALIFVAKSTLDQAAYNGVREGTLNHGRRSFINLGVAKGLTPLYQRAFSSGDRSLINLGLARAEALADIADPFRLSVEIINPSLLSFADFGTEMTDEFGVSDQGIPNTGLLYLATDVGTTSQQSIQDANLLKIRVHYCYRLIVPVVRTLLKTALGGGIGFDAQCYDSGGSPIQATSIMRMQSPAFLTGLAL